MSSEQQKRQSEPKRKSFPTTRRHFLLVVAVLGVAIGLLSYKAFESSSVYYLRVSELKQKGESAYGDKFRVSGQVAPGSIQRDLGTLQFLITEGGQQLPVRYKGPVPDIFRDGAEVVVEGRYQSADLFEASKLLTKCPSKYESQPASPSESGAR